MKLITSFLSCALMSVTLAGGAARASDYPKSTVTVVVPFSPGSAVDPAARFVAGALQDLWGVSVVVENKPGAGSTIGTGQVARSAPDGSVLLFTSAAFATTAAIYKNLPYNPLELEPVAQASEASFIFTGSPKLKANTLAELIAESKERKLFLGTAGLGSGVHLAGELFVKAAGINSQTVHYKGGSEALLDLMAGRADIYVGTTVGIGSNVAEKSVKGFGVFGDRRASSIPDVPTTTELGLKGLEIGFWLGLFAPPGTPQEIVEKINADVTSVLQSPEALAFLEKTASVHKPMPPATFKEKLQNEIELWKGLADDINLSVQ